MRTGRMTAASAHGYIVVGRGQLWHRRPVRGIEAHLGPSFTTKPPARIPTSSHDRQRARQRGVARVGPAQTPATIPHSDRLSKESRHRRSGLPVRVIRPENGWMLLCVGGGVGCDVAVTVAVSSAQVVRWQADPDRRPTRPEDRKRRGSMNDGGRRPSDRSVECVGSVDDLGGAVVDLAVNRSFVDVALTQGLRFKV